MDCSPPGSDSVHGISYTRILEWVAASFSCLDLVKIVNLVELGSPSSTPYSPTRQHPLKSFFLEIVVMGSFHCSSAQDVADTGLNSSVNAARSRWREWGLNSWDLGSLSLSKLTQTSFRPQIHLYECWEDRLISTRAFGEGYSDDSYQEAPSFKPFTKL